MTKRTKRSSQRSSLLRRRHSAATVQTHAIPEDDPFWQAALRAPVDDGPIPEEELAAVQEAANGRFTDGDVVSASIDALRP